MSRRPKRSRRNLARATTLLVLVVLVASGCAPLERLRARLEMRQGNLSYLRGDYAEAIEHYDRALEHQPEHRTAALNRAYADVARFRETDDLLARRALADSAVTSFERYLELVESGRGPRPASRESVEQQMLTLYLDSQQSGEAMQLLDARLARNPKDVSAILMLANMAFERGEVARALELHRRHISLEPESPEAHHGLGVAAWQFSHDDRLEEEQRRPVLDEGLRAALRAVELKPDYFDALVYVNLLYRELAEHAASPEERAEFEEKSREYHARAQEARAAQQSEAPQGST